MLGIRPRHSKTETAVTYLTSSFSCKRSGSSRISDAVFLQFPVEPLAAQPESPGGMRPISNVLQEYLLQIFPLECVRGFRQWWAPLTENSGCEMCLGQSPGSRAENQRLYDFVLQLSHVARPRVPQQNPLGLYGELGHSKPESLGLLGQHPTRQRKYVRRPLSKRRKLDRRDLEAKEQVFTKVPPPSFLFETPVGRRQ